MKNVIQFKNNFINLKDSNSDNYQLAMSVVSELMQFGFILDKEAIDNLSKASSEDITTFHNEVITYLKEITGSKTSYKPFWKGFPQEVMEKTECELWLHQIVHYMSNGEYEPNEWTKERPTAFEQPKFQKITAGDDVKFLNIFTILVSVNQSLTPSDLDTIKWFVSSGTELVMPNVIPFKENLCTLASMGLDVPVKTVTDVLRIAVGMSGGDISLPKVPFEMVRTNAWSRAKSFNPKRLEFRFKKFTRAERRLILTLLEKTNCDATEAVLKDQRWVRLGEIIHPGEYKKHFPKSFDMFNAIRNTKVQSWYGKVDVAFNKSFEDGLNVLSQRAGEFMRRLDWLIRTNDIDDKKNVLYTTLENVIGKVSNKVLFETYTHFDGRGKTVTNRSIMVKGSRTRTKLPDLPALDIEDIERVKSIIIGGLKNKFNTLSKLDKVWVDEELKNIPLPSNMRSMNASLKPRVRGVRIPIGNQKAKVIRAFVHWMDERGNRDIDLTATFIGMGRIKRIGWNGEHSGHEGCYSGDIRHRQGPCAEYIDIDVNESLKSGYKYVIIDAHNYNGGSFESITDCVAGFMEREFPEADEIFVPATLANTVRLTSEASTTIVTMVDLETQEYIFLDIDASGIPVASANFDNIMAAIQPYMEPPRFSVYDLVLLHVDARGGELAEKDLVETTFGFDEYADSYVKTLELMGV